MRNRGKPATNPFQYGVVVRGPAFADRRSELQQLTSALVNRERVFLISPCRYGKTLVFSDVSFREWIRDRAL